MKVYTDGRCTNNQGPMDKRSMRAGVVDETGSVLIDKTMNGGSNNIAEVWAIAEGLQTVRRVTDADSAPAKVRVPAAIFEKFTTPAASQS